ncbi:MAG TPA: hypothetical protein VLG09_04025 [Candidatus Saccharimonadales bacterium]|nr:hypothetical protein [Candidatus Saccharimonadales bacterium]
MLEGLGIHFVPEFTPTTLTLIAIVVVWWIKGIPDRKRVELDGQAKLRSDLFGQIEQIRADHRDCEEKLHKLQAGHDGLQRQFIAYQLAVAQAIPPSARSAEITSMINKLVDMAKDGGDK